MNNFFVKKDINSNSPSKSNQPNLRQCSISILPENVKKSDFSDVFGGIHIVHPPFWGGGGGGGELNFLTNFQKGAA